jgi:hypothetical protein
LGCDVGWQKYQWRSKPRRRFEDGAVATPAALEPSAVEKAVNADTVVRSRTSERRVESRQTSVGPDANHEGPPRKPGLREPPTRRLNNTGQGIIFVVERDANNGFDTRQIGERLEPPFDIRFELFCHRAVTIISVIEGSQILSFGSSAGSNTQTHILPGGYRVNQASNDLSVTKVVTRWCPASRLGNDGSESKPS